MLNIPVGQGVFVCFFVFHFLLGSRLSPTKWDTEWPPRHLKSGVLCHSNVVLQFTWYLLVVACGIEKAAHFVTRPAFQVLRSLFFVPVCRRWHGSKMRNETKRLGSSDVLRDRLIFSYLVQRFLGCSATCTLTNLIPGNQQGRYQLRLLNCTKEKELFKQFSAGKLLLFLYLLLALKNDSLECSKVEAGTIFSDALGSFDKSGSDFALWSGCLIDPVLEFWSARNNWKSGFRKMH